jgi:hypothetical protein
MTHELKILVVEQMGDVRLPTGEKVVHANDIMAVVEEAFAKVRTEKTGSAGDEDAFHDSIVGVLVFEPLMIANDR